MIPAMVHNPLTPTLYCVRCVRCVLAYASLQRTSSLQKNKNTPKGKGSYGISLIVGEPRVLLFHYISLGIPRYPAIISLSAAYATYATYATYAKYTGGSCCDKRRAGSAFQTDDAVVANPDPADAHAVAVLRFQPTSFPAGYARTRLQPARMGY